MSDAEEYKLPLGAELQADGSVLYALAYPIRIEDKGATTSVDTVTIRRKRMDDNLAIKRLDNPVDIAVTLIERLTGLDHKAVRLIDDIDHEAIGEIITGFSTPGRTIGSRSPA